MITNKLIEQLIQDAKDRHGDNILPTEKTFQESITVYKNQALLWYNTPEQATFIVKRDITN